MINKKEKDPTIEKIHKIREEISQETKNMTLEERLKYVDNEACDYINEFNEYKNKNLLEKEILDYYKDQYGTNYVTELNNDLKKIIEFKKSLKA